MTTKTAAEIAAEINQGHAVRAEFVRLANDPEKYLAKQRVRVTNARAALERAEAELRAMESTVANFDELIERHDAKQKKLRQDLALVSQKESIARMKELYTLMKEMNPAVTIDQIVS